MNDYRFINIDQEPTDEQLEQLMHEVAVEAKERHDRHGRNLSEGNDGYGHGRRE